MRPLQPEEVAPACVLRIGGRFQLHKGHVLPVLGGERLTNFAAPSHPLVHRGIDDGLYAQSRTIGEFVGEFRMSTNCGHRQAWCDSSLAVPRASKAPQRRVLVVDDNADSAASLGMLLKFLGTDVQITRCAHCPGNRGKLPARCHSFRHWHVSHGRA